MDQALTADLAKRSAMRTVQSDIGNCSACSASPMPSFLNGLAGSIGFGCDCEKTGVAKCHSCKGKMGGLGQLTTGGYVVGLLLIAAIGAGVAWKMGYLGKKATAARRKNRRRKR